MNSIGIRQATKHDWDDIWGIIEPVIAKGDTYVFDPNSSKEEMLGYWCNAAHYTYVTTIDQKIVGTFIIKDSQPGLGAHVANASFITATRHAGKGIGTAMGTFAIEEARRLGYQSMQFNIVVKTNEVAVRLWQKLGFEIIGEVPLAFDHKELGLVNAYIMWRKL